MEQRPLPFYMSYPMPYRFFEENEMVRDLEYLQQMYPARAKRYQKRIVEILNRLDYTGSMIYDEYPDKLMLYRLAHDVTDTLRREETEKQDGEDDTDWKSIEEMIQLLLFYEIFKMRGDRKRGILKF
ncbi:MAG: hypothetical protein ACI4SZ_07770 [Lachnospiraceae bacterium]